MGTGMCDQRDWTRGCICLLPHSADTVSNRPLRPGIIPICRELSSCLLSSAACPLPPKTHRAHILTPLAGPPIDMLQKPYVDALPSPHPTACRALLPTFYPPPHPAAAPHPATPQHLLFPGKNEGSFRPTWHASSHQSRMTRYGDKMTNGRSGRAGPHPAGNCIGFIKWMLPALPLLMAASSSSGVYTSTGTPPDSTVGTAGACAPARALKEHIARSTSARHGAAGRVSARAAGSLERDVLSRFLRLIEAARCCISPGALRSFSELFLPVLWRPPSLLRWVASRHACLE